MCELCFARGLIDVQRLSIRALIASQKQNPIEKGEVTALQALVFGVLRYAKIAPSGADGDKHPGNYSLAQI